MLTRSKPGSPWWGDQKQIKIVTLRAKKFDLIFIITAIIFFACKKDYYHVDPDLHNMVTGSVAGRVTDLYNVPVSDAMVTAGTSVTTTDIDGHFTLKNVDLEKDLGFVKVTHDGYFTGSRTFFSNSNSVNNVKIRLIPKTVSGNFAASPGGIVEISGGGSINIGESSIVNATTGAGYTGNVSVSTFYLNPADANINEFMPGDLRGIDVNNQSKMLQSFGMIAIEMNDDNGEKMQLAPAKTATITLPISSAFNNAPATIPLWYFDEINGIWKEEGSATKQGNNYVGAVAHFSFWNCDLPADNIKLEITFKDKNGDAYPNKFVTISSSTYGTRSCYTDSSGKVSGLVPANENLTLTVFDQCGEIVYTKDVGSFNSDEDLGSIAVNTFSNEPVVTISGTVVNCSNDAVTNGFVQVMIGNNFFNATGNNFINAIGSNFFNAPITKGSFSITFPLCTNLPASITAYDVGESRFSVPQTINVINGNQDIGQLIACSYYTFR